MSNIMDFGFDDSKVIKTSGVERFKQDRSGRCDRVSLVAFKTFHDVILVAKAREKGGALTDQEKAEICAKIDAKLGENLSKKPEDLTEVDKLDIKSPRFSFAFTHWGDGVGGIRCLSTYEGTTLVKPELCCKKMGDADQTVATVMLQYPVDKDNQVDMDLLRERKYTELWIWKLSSKKFKKVEGAYIDARNDNRPVVDLKITLDGDPKYQKQVIEVASSAVWAREDTDPAIRLWVLEQGLRGYKYVKESLGFEMKAETLAEKLGGAAASAAALAASPETSASKPALQQSYDDLLS
jgi:hypothetical protein